MEAFASAAVHPVARGLERPEKRTVTLGDVIRNMVFDSFVRTDVNHDIGVNLIRADIKAVNPKLILSGHTGSRVRREKVVCVIKPAMRGNRPVQPCAACVIRSGRAAPHCQRAVIIGKRHALQVNITGTNIFACNHTFPLGFQIPESDCTGQVNAVYRLFYLRIFTIQVGNRAGQAVGGLLHRGKGAFHACHS